MKRVIRCLTCSNPTRLYGSYSVELDEKILNPLTGEIKFEKIQGKICKDCAVLAGYKDRRKNLNK